MASSLNAEYLLSLREIDPEFKELLENDEIPPLVLNDYETLKEIRKVMDDTRVPTVSPNVKVSDLQYSTSDGSTNRAKLYQPRNRPQDGSPLIVMFHGGGFTLGAPEDEEACCVNCVNAFGAVCVSVGYRLAPEFKFPYAVKDSWDGLRWAAQNATSWGVDPSTGFIIGGTSAGGNITAVLAHQARDENLSPPLTGQYLSVPAVLPSQVVPEKYKPFYLSLEQNRDDPHLKDSMKYFETSYGADVHDAVWYSSFNHPKGHENLPPAFFQIDGADPLRDEGMIYEHVLREESGVKTRLNVYPGLPHGHWLLHPQLKSSTKFRREQVEGVGWLLGRTADFTNVLTSPQATSN